MRPAFLALLALAAAALPAAAQAAPKTVWLCRPGLAKNPCGQSQKTTYFTTAGKKIRVKAVKPGARKIDCFYVYPTVSDQKRDVATLHVDPEERSIALYQAARYSRECRVYAPMYRQDTLQGIGKALAGKPDTTPVTKSEGYADVKRAWLSYLKRDNHGRGVVFIGHSQGAFLLRSFIAKEIDPKPAIRKRLVSAILLGGNVLVKKSGGAGGDFKHVRACHSRTQLACVIAFSTYGDTPPKDSLFGRTSGTLGGKTAKGLKVLCTNPTALGGGSGLATAEYPSAPFAPGTTIAAAVTIVGTDLPKAATPWISVPGAYTARCSSAGGANVLRITPRGVAPRLKPSPNATWGLHLVDANIALGNLVNVVRAEAAAFVKRG